VVVLLAEEFDTRNAVDVDDGRTVDAHEVIRQVLVEPTHGLLLQKAPLGGEQQHVVALGLGVEQLADAHDVNVRPFFDRDSVDRLALFGRGRVARRQLGGLVRRVGLLGRGLATQQQRQPQPARPTAHGQQRGEVREGAEGHPASRHRHAPTRAQAEHQHEHHQPNAPDHRGDEPRGQRVEQTPRQQHRRVEGRHGERRTGVGLPVEAHQSTHRRRGQHRPQGGDPPAGHLFGDRILRHASLRFDLDAAQDHASAQH